MPTKADAVEPQDTSGWPFGYDWRSALLVGGNVPRFFAVGGAAISFEEAGLSRFEPTSEPPGPVRILGPADGSTFPRPGS